MMFMHVGACGGEQKEEVARRAGYDAHDQQLKTLKKQLQEEKSRSRQLKDEAQLSKDHVYHKTPPPLVRICHGPHVVMLDIVERFILSFTLRTTVPAMFIPITLGMMHILMTFGT